MSARDAGRDVSLESYLARLDAALRGVAADDRREILLETRSHVAEQTRRAPARPVDEVLAELGSPEEYARQFLPDGAPPAAAPPPRASALHAFARVATGGWVTLPLLFLVVAAYSIAMLVFIVAVTKLLDPDHIGLWVNDPGKRPRFFFGITDTTPAGREVLGYWLVAIALAISLAIHLAVSALLKRFFRGGVRRS